jgi:hypothetical protein
MMKKTVLTCVLAVLSDIQMAAQGATAKDVNVVNTPTVQLAGTSTVQVSGTTNVRVQNDSTAPVPVQDISKPKQTPFQSSQNFGPFPFATGNTTVSVAVLVPSGKRLVIEQISAQASNSFTTQNSFVQFTVSTTVAGVSVQHFLEAPQVFNFTCQTCDNQNQSHNVLSQQVKFYADAGSTVQLTAMAEIATGGVTDVNFVISGYLEDAQ